MKTNSIIVMLAILFLSALLLFTSCQKDLSEINPASPAGKQQVSIYLNDDPVHYLKVLVDIQRVEVKIDTGNHHYDDHHYDGDDDDDDDHHGHDSYGQWDTLNITPGVYDLLRLRNGVDTLLANGYSLNGRITKIRITLGNGNVIWTDSTHHFPLSICNNKPYVYVKVGANTIDTLPGGAIIVRIDFNVGKSIKMKDGKFCLKPEIKAYSHHHTGEIEGKVLPVAAKASVMVFNSTDTAYAIPDDEGEYKIKGLSEGVYSILFDATLPYLDSTISNIRVRKEEDTKIEKMVLRK